MRALSLLAATLSMGLSAGVFALFAHTLMPGLKTTDDRTFVTSFQAIDRAIVNPWFMLTAFAGALVFTVAAAVANRGGAALTWILVALGLYVVAFVVTVAVHLPLNDAIKAAGAHDFAAVRARFDEGRWAAWNLVRVATSGGAFACLCWALVLYGRSTA
jgi:uncharacterized membrane protein